jgi:hypothetical protein
MRKSRATAFLPQGQERESSEGQRWEAMNSPQDEGQEGCAAAEGTKQIDSLGSRTVEGKDRFIFPFGTSPLPQSLLSS